MKNIFKNFDLFKGKANGFTLAETLITLGIIGIVAAVTIPTLMKNYQEKVRAEQVRMVKYKLTQATSVMNTDGLIKPYPTTQDFVNQLQKYLKISKVCDHNHLTDCWPVTEITVPKSQSEGDGLKTTLVTNIKKGTDLLALGLGTANTNTVGIVLADGTPMILTYSPVCTPLDQYKSYPYSTQDGKPVTNATTNCISAIFDINGKSKPNKLGTDVRTLNSIFGYQKYNPTYITKAECEKLRAKGLVKGCSYNTDYFAGAVKKCNDLGLHLPDEQTLTNIVCAKYGRTDIGIHTIVGAGIYRNPSIFKEIGSDPRTNFIWVSGNDIPNGTNSSLASFSGGFWSSSELDSMKAVGRNAFSGYSHWSESNRNNNTGEVLCVGD